MSTEWEASLYRFGFDAALCGWTCPPLTGREVPEARRVIVAGYQAGLDAAAACRRAAEAWVNESHVPRDPPPPGATLDP